MRVRDVMSEHPVTVGPETTVAEARRAGEDAGSRSVVVTDRASVLGVLEEERLWLSPEDVLRTAAGLQDTLTAREQERARTAMRPAVPALSANESLTTAARLMLLKHRTALPVIEKGRLVGLLSVAECRQALGAPVQAVPHGDPDHASEAGWETSEEEGTSDHAVA